MYECWHGVYVCWHVVYVCWHGVYVCWHVVYVCWQVVYVCWHVVYVCWHVVYECWHVVYVCWHVVYVCWQGVYVGMLCPMNAIARHVRNVAPQSVPLSLATALYRFRICDQQHLSSLIPRPSRVTLCFVSSQFRYEVNVQTHYEAHNSFSAAVLSGIPCQNNVAICSTHPYILLFFMLSTSDIGKMFPTQ